MIMIIDVIAQTRLFYSSEETSEKQETLISVYRDNWDVIEML